MLTFFHGTINANKETFIFKSVNVFNTLDIVGLIIYVNMNPNIGIDFTFLVHISGLTANSWSLYVILKSIFITFHKNESKKKTFPCISCSADVKTHCLLTETIFHNQSWIKSSVVILFSHLLLFHSIMCHITKVK